MPSQFVVENLASALLGICAGIFNAWAAARYGQTEKRYLVGGASSMAGFALIILYEFSTHRWAYLTGPYLIFMFVVPWIVRFKSTRAH
jgi:hypothetical protein